MLKSSVTSQFFDAVCQTTGWDYLYLCKGSPILCTSIAMELVAVSRQLARSDSIINLLVWCHCFPPTRRYFPSHRASPPPASTKLYCLVTEAHVCEQLAQSCYTKVEWLRVDLATSWYPVRCPNLYDTRGPTARKTLRSSNVLRVTFRLTWSDYELVSWWNENMIWGSKSSIGDVLYVAVSTMPETAQLVNLVATYRRLYHSNFQRKVCREFLW